MKKIAVISKIFFVLILFINCKTKNVEPEFEINPNNLKRVWMLVEFKDFKKEQLTKNAVQMNLTNFKNPSSFAGCNQISFQIEVKNDKIKIKDVIATEMFCEDKMILENAFSKSLLEINSYSIKGHTLTLLNDKNYKMVFVAQDWD